MQVQERSYKDDWGVIDRWVRGVNLYMTQSHNTVYLLYVEHTGSMLRDIPVRLSRAGLLVVPYFIQ